MTSKASWKTHFVGVSNSLTLLLSVVAGIEIAESRWALFAASLGGALSLDYAGTVLWMGAYRAEFFSGKGAV